MNDYINCSNVNNNELFKIQVQLNKNKRNIRYFLNLFILHLIHSCRCQNFNVIFLTKIVVMN